MHVGGGAVDTPSGSDALLEMQVAEHALQGSPPCQYTVGQAVGTHSCTDGGVVAVSPLSLIPILPRLTTYVVSFASEALLVKKKKKKKK